jgi:hypothetical protein
MATELGHNIKVIDKPDRILIVISKDAKLQKTATGNSKIVARTNKFEGVGDISGDKFSNSELGLNLLLTVRPKKAVKKKKPRLDDDDDGD